MKKSLWMRISNLLTVLFVIFFLLNYAPAKAQPKVPAGFSHELFSGSGWTDITCMAFDSAGRLYVGEHKGTIWRVDANGVKSSVPVIDISEEVGWWNAHGLMNFILDKDFISNGYIYLYYTVDRHHLLYYGTPQYNSNVDEYHNATIERVTRYKLDANTNFATVVPGSRFVLIGQTKKNGIPITYNHHDGSGMAFAKDGTLLISTGDGGHGGQVDTGSNSTTFYQQALLDTILTPATNVGAFRAQLLQAMNGKLLRIDPMTGLGVSSNPFYDSQHPESTESKVWALGLRQPFRLTIRPGTGSTNPVNGDPGIVYVEDVGFYNWEELNVVTAPAQNFGWPIYEGMLPHPNFSKRWTYNLNAPNPLYGTGGCTQQYFRFIDLLANDTQGAPSWPNPCNTAIQIPPTVNRWVHRRASFAYAHQDTITYIPTFTGSAPTVAQLGSPGTNTTGSPFTGNCIAGSAWNRWTDWPSMYQGADFFCEYDKGFIRYAKYDSQQTLLSIDSFATGLDRPICINWNPVQHCIYYIDYPNSIHRIRYTLGINVAPVAIATQNKKYGPGPLTVKFGSDSYDPENGPLTYAWTFGDGGTSTKSNPNHTFSPPTSAPTKYIVSLTVTDTGGLSNSTSLIVSVNNTPPHVHITSPVSGIYYSASATQNYNLTASVSDAEQNASQLHYLWFTTLHHNEHDHPNPPDTDVTSNLITDPEDCENIYWYEIRLTVTDDAGLSTTDTVVMYQACPPDTRFTVSKDTVCKGGSLQFSDASDRFPNSWLWQFPGGTPSTSTSRNPVVSYPTVGSFNVTLIASQPGGSDTLTKTGYIQVKALPQATITAAGPVSFCTGGSVVLNANVNSQYAYQWKKDNSELTGSTAYSYTASGSGSYSVVETNKNSCSKESGPVVVTSSLVAKIKAGGPTTFCTGGSVALTASPAGTGYTYQWTRNSVNIAGATSANYMAATAGTYKVLVTQGAGCSNLSKAKVVTINCREGQPFETADLANVFPNPAITSFTVEPSDNMESNFNLVVRDITGRIVETGSDISPDNNYTFGSSLSEGVYLVTVTCGEKVQQLRVIKEK